MITDEQKLEHIREICITYHAVIDALMHTPETDDVNTLTYAITKVLDGGGFDRAWFIDQISGDGQVHGVR